MSDVKRDEEQVRIRIYAIAFVGKAITLSTNDRDDFWLEVPGNVGWMKFTKLRTEDEFTPNGALFAASEVRPGSDPAPSPVVVARVVLWRQREALLSAAKTCSFLLGQGHSDL